MSALSFRGWRSGGWPATDREPNRHVVPLTDDYSETPYWWRDGGIPDPSDERELPKEADVLVVGAGYTGVSAARHLQMHGRGAVVLEQRLLGRGASSRNAGSTHPGLTIPVDRLIARYGPFGRRLYDETVAAFEHCEATIREEHIACDYARSGVVQLAATKGEMRRLEELASVYRMQIGVPAQVVARSELDQYAGTSTYAGGVITDLWGLLHPARYFSGLLSGAAHIGAEFHEETRVERIEPRRAGFSVVTSRGTLTARDVLVTTDGYTDAAMPQLSRRIVPFASNVLVTEPLGEDLAHSVSPTGRFVVDSGTFVLAWRTLPGGRVLFGGRTHIRTATLASARARLYRLMVDALPQLAGVRIAAMWRGTVGFTFDNLPHIGKLEGVTYALGYCGGGVALSGYFGAQAAVWIAGGDPPVFSEIGLPAPPRFHRARRCVSAAGGFSSRAEGFSSRPRGLSRSR